MESEAHGTWVKVPILDAKAKILPLTWVLWCKHTPEEKLRSSNLICVFKDIYKKEYLIPLLQLYHGHLSKSSLFSLWWPAGKLAVLISQMHSYMPSKLNEPIWIHLPGGFRTAGPGKTCLHLICSRYGISEAPRLWYQHLLKVLLDLGLKQCQHDQYLFYKANLLIVL
jgi:hypothetical protein